MAVFDAPPVPNCWQGGEVIRIVDPLGLQVVWVSPALAGGIVGYYARRSSMDVWTEVLACSEEAGRLAGSELLLRDSITEQMVPVRGTDATWSFASRDPTETTVSGRIQDHVLKVSLQCADGELQILIEAGDASPRIPDAGLRLHLGVAAGRMQSTAPTDGVVQLRGGTLESIACRHSSELTCQVREEGKGPGDQQIDFVPSSRVHVDGGASPLVISLFPTPASPTSNP